MIEAPSRISRLIERIEAGDMPTDEDLRRVALLQALDVAKSGEDFVRQSCEEEDKRTNEFREYLETL